MLQYPFHASSFLIRRVHRFYITLSLYSISFEQLSVRNSARMSLKRKRSAPVIILLSSDSSDGDSSAKSGPTCKGSSQRKPRSTPVKPPLSGNINSKAGQRHSTALDSPSKRATEDVGERGNSHGKKNKYKNKTSFKSYKYISRRGKPVPSTLLSRWLVRVEGQSKVLLPSRMFVTCLGSLPKSLKTL